MTIEAIEVSLLPVCYGMTGVIVINKPFIIYFKRSYRLFSFVGKFVQEIRVSMHSSMQANDFMCVLVYLNIYLSKSINFSK